MRSILSTLTLIALVVALDTRPALGQRGAAEDSGELRRDLDFARALAERPGEFDLAERELAALERSGWSAKQREELALAKAEIYFEGARHNASRRAELLTLAMDAYRTYSTKSLAPEQKAAAEAELARVWIYYAHDLARKFEDAAGEDRTKLRDQLIGVLNATVAKTAELANALSNESPDSRTEIEQQRLFELTYSKGDMLLELARVESDGSASFEKATQTFAKLAHDAGEGTPWSLRAMIGLGDVLSAQGQQRDAVDYYERAVLFAIPRDADSWNELAREITDDERLARFLFVELATPGLMRALVADDRVPEAVAWGLHFYNTAERENFALDDPDGYLALLELARTLAGAGGFIELGESACTWHATRADFDAALIAPERTRTAVEFALALAERVNEFGRGGELAVLAQRCIAAIVALPGVSVGPRELLEAAKAEFNDADYGAAVPAMQRVAAALIDADASARKQLMPQVLWHIGRGFQAEQRALEAAVAFESSLEDWRGDTEFDQRNARGMLEACESLERDPDQGRQFGALAANARRLAAEVGGPVGAPILYEEAEGLYASEQWAAAMPLFARVDAAAANYEKARVLVGVCALRLGGRDAAAAIFDDYLERYVDSPAHQTIDARALVVRNEARALATFCAGEIAFESADLGAGDWRCVIERLGDFHARFADQISFAPAALWRVLVAHARLGELEPMRAVLATLEKNFATSEFTAHAALAAHDALEDASNAESDPIRRTALAREMALDMRLVNRITRPPNFDALRREAQLWLECEDWPAAESVLQHTAELFSRGVDGERVTRFVLPDLGRALLAQHKLQAAAAALGPLVDAKTATRDTARNYARALAGWLESAPGANGGEAQFVELPGLGGDANFEKAVALLHSLADSAPQNTADWFALQFDLLYAYRQYGQVDAAQLATAKRLLAKLRTDLGPGFEHEHMPEDLRRRFVWLAQALK